MSALISSDQQEHGLRPVPLTQNSCRDAIKDFVQGCAKDSNVERSMELIPVGTPNGPSLPPDTSVVSSVTSTVDTTLSEVSAPQVSPPEADARHARDSNVERSMELIPVGTPNGPSLPPDTSVVSSVTSTVDTTLSEVSAPQVSPSEGDARHEVECQGIPHHDLQQRGIHLHPPGVQKLLEHFNFINDRWCHRNCHGIFMKAAISSATSCDACKTARSSVRMSRLPELFSRPKTVAEISYSNGTICEIISNSAATFATTDSFQESQEAQEFAALLSCIQEGDS